jgi:penicillin-binding protein 1A
MPPRPAAKRRKSTPRQRNWFWRHRRLLFFTVLFLFTGLAAAIYILIRVPLPAEAVQKQTSFLTDINGNRLASLDAGEDRVSVKLGDVPQVVQQAVLAAEDRNFFHHSGVDPIGILRATINDLRGKGGLQGGSTITQQYVKNTYVGQERTIYRKLREAVLAIKVERKLSKDEILERYLNTIYFGRGAYGVEAASRAYFGKDVEVIGLREAAYLAGLIRAPQYADALRSPATATERRHHVLENMRHEHMITAADEADVESTPWPANKGGYVIDQQKLEPKVVNTSSGTDYFVDYVRRQLAHDYGDAAVSGGGLRVKTTLDLKMQSQAFSSVYGFLNKSGDPAGALVAVDDAGNIKAMVGGRDWATSKVNLALGSGGGGGGRQAGSTFKPFLLAETVREGYTVESSFPAPPKITIPKADNGKDWKVTNYDDKDYGSEVNLIDATKNSINTVYAQLVVTLGADKLKTMAQNLGIKSPLPQANALVLGAAEVSPLEMASAFSTFADRGMHYEPRSILEVRGPDDRVIKKLPTKPDGKRVLTTKQVDVVNFVLRQVVEHGTGTGASWGKTGALVGKTGTTDDYADAWFVGGTTKLTAAVWLGDPAGRVPMTDVRGVKVNGGSFPATIFRGFMQKATSGLDLGTYPDVTSFPGDVLKGDRIPFDSTTTSVVSGTTRTSTTPTTSPGPPPITPTSDQFPPITRTPRETTVPDRHTTTTKKRRNN